MPPIASGVPYKSWDRAGRDLMTTVILTLLIWVASSISDLNIYAAKEAETLIGMQRQITELKFRFTDFGKQEIENLRIHESKAGHDTTVANMGKLDGRVTGLERMVYTGAKNE